MASKRVLASIPNLARLASPASASRALLKPRRPAVATPFITTIRLAHGIPRPRNPSPFKQQAVTTATTTPSSDPSQSSQTTPPPPPTTTTSSHQTVDNKAPPNITQQPHYELTFTCRPCDTRSRHRISKHGYHHGSVLIACPGCRNRHVISDHLRIFGDTARTVEDILKEKGEFVKKGTLGEEGDLEFWDDGSSTVREPWVEREKGEADAEGGKDLPPGSTFKSVRPGEKKGE